MFCLRVWSKKHWIQTVLTSQGDFENEKGPEQPNSEADPSSTDPNPPKRTIYIWGGPAFILRAPRHSSIPGVRMRLTRTTGQVGAISRTGRMANLCI